MHQVVRSHQPEDMADALRTALRMHAGALELLRCQLLPEVQIGGSKCSELIRGERERYVAIATLSSPAVLIIGLELRPLLGEHHSGPEACDQIAVPQMLNHVDDGPFLGSFRPP